MGKGYTHFSYCLATAPFLVADFSSGLSLDGLFGGLRRPALTPNVLRRAPLILPAIGPLFSMRRRVRTCCAADATAKLVGRACQAGMPVGPAPCHNNIRPRFRAGRAARPVRTVEA